MPTNNLSAPMEAGIEAEDNAPRIPQDLGPALCLIRDRLFEANTEFEEIFETFCQLFMSGEELRGDYKRLVATAKSKVRLLIGNLEKSESIFILENRRLKITEKLSEGVRKVKGEFRKKRISHSREDMQSECK